MTLTKVLIAYEKHGDAYYDASTDEALAKSALHILTNRDKAGYWYRTPDELYPDDDKYSTSLKQLVPDYDPDADLETRKAILAAYKKSLESIPDEQAKALATKRLKNAVQRQADKREYAKWYNAMREIVDAQDWESVVTYKSGRIEPKSWRILNERDGEYERVSLEKVWTVGKDD